MAMTDDEYAGWLVTSGLAAQLNDPNAVAAHTFTSGAKRSKKMPRFDLIPIEGLRCIADRFEMGMRKYARDNWKKGVGSEDFEIDALNHMQHHLSALMAGDEGEDDAWGNLGAIGFGVVVLAYSLARKKKKGLGGYLSGSFPMPGNPAESEKLAKERSGLSYP